MEHYFTNNKNLKENINEINARVKDTEFVFYTDNGVFNKKGLDYGTRVLLENIDLSNKLSFFRCRMWMWTYWNIYFKTK